MKKSIFFTSIIVFAVTMLFGCIDNNDYTDADTKSSIFVKVENASKYSHIVEVKLMCYDKSKDRSIELASGDWKDDGFTIVLPKTLEPNYFNALVNNGEIGFPTIINTSSTMNINNKNVKVGSVNFWGVDKDGNWVTHFYPFEIDKDGDAKSAFYTFVDADVTISGYTESNTVIGEYDEEINATILHEWKTTTNYSVKWKKGWNVWSLSKSESAPERTITEKWSNVSIDELKWYAGEDLSELNIN